MQIKINGKKHTLPESWAEVPFKKREKLFSILLVSKLQEAKTVALYQLLGIPKGMFLQINNEDIAAMTAQMGWFSLEASATPVQSYIEHRKTRYYFPKADFANGTALEFLQIQELYSEFIQTEYPLNLVVLRRISAVVCRELDKATRKRTLLIEHNERLEERNVVFSDLSIVQATMVLKYVQGVLGLVEQVGKSFDIFGKPSEQNSQEVANVNLFGWKSVFRSVAEIGSYGTYNDVLQRPFWDIIEILAEREASRKAQQELIDDAKGNQTVSD